MPRKLRLQGRKDPLSITGLRRALGLVRPVRHLLFASLVAELVLVSTIIIRPQLVRWLIDDGVTGGNEDLILVISLILLSTWVLRFGLAIVTNLCTGRAGIRIMAALRRDVYEHVQSLSVRFFDQTQAGRIVSRADRDAESLQPMLVHMPPHLFGMMTRLFASCTMLLITAPSLVLWLLPLVPVSVGIMWIFKRVVSRLWDDLMEHKSQVTGHAVETVHGVRLIQQMVYEEANRSVYREYLRQLDRAACRLFYGWGWFPGFTLLLNVTGLAIVIIVGGYGVANDTLSVGQLVASMFYVFMFLGPLQAMSEMFERVAEGSAAAARIFELLDTAPEIQDGPEARELEVNGGRISYEQVNFAYGGADPDNHIIDDFTVDIHAGETVAIVGPTGHGKSTLVQLLTRFYDVRSGAILVDGQDIRDVTQGSLRRRVAVVLQDNVLFTGSVLDNLRLARAEELTDEALIQACKDLGADHVLSRLGQGYHTPVGPQGKHLSQGQRQLVCLVRAYLADPDILVLDEATSAVDIYTERRIQRALRRLCQNRTAIIIAHRLATIRNADRILVIRDGSLVEEGPHSELITRDGEYARLYATYEAGEEGS